MSEQIATGERPRYCEMCEHERAFPPAVFCDACIAYMADCEAEMGSDQ